MKVNCTFCSYFTFYRLPVSSIAYLLSILTPRNRQASSQNYNRTMARKPPVVGATVLGMYFISLPGITPDFKDVERNELSQLGILVFIKSPSMASNGSLGNSC